MNRITEDGLFLRVPTRGGVALVPLMQDWKCVACGAVHRVTLEEVREGAGSCVECSSELAPASPPFPDPDDPLTPGR